MTDLFRVFGRIGLLSFGGPAAQIALMHKELVEDRSWLTEDQYLRALSFCMLLPGPEAMQLATYAGWRLRGVPGGILAGALFVLPGAAVVMALAWIYALFGGVPLVEALFVGIKAAVVIIVLQALLKVAKKALHGIDRWVIAGLAFAGIFALNAPFPVIIAAAGCWGYFTAKGEAVDSATVATPNTLRTIAIWGALWLIPVALASAFAPVLLGPVAQFFSILAVVTFGGAYAVLAYMTQTVVDSYGWLTTAQMIDALGLAETTPGPLILVTEFVGFLAGFAQGGAALAFAAALLTLWVTFIPCFLWIFAAAPYIERLAAHPRIGGALQAVTAAVVGVILNLSIWFALHVFFTDVGRATLGPIEILAPVVSSVAILPVALAVLAGALLLVFRWPLLRVLAVMAGISAGISLIG
ncbi:chromate efflux transporter [Actibacterium mucosum]|nr:chromate efflux transporter [Actibacterium mucosum]